MIEELETIIKKAALDGTLTESAAKQVQETIEENRYLNKRAETWEAESRKLKLRERQLEAQVKSFEDQASAVAKRESDVAEREEKMTELELSAKHHEQRVADHRMMFQMVFRNIEVRRNVFPVQPGLAGDHGMVHTYPTVEERVQTETSE